jgi:methyl-accepting chemotaxis protein
LSQGATDQAASLEETSASMEEIAAMTRQNAEHTQAAAATMAETERLVIGANGALNEMVASMTAIKESSAKVSKIIRTIDEIAFQTNILALNAAVEAARAGDAGMGFAVVAEEVRALAQRSADAAKDTAGLIEESIARSNEGNARVQQVTGAIQSITASTVKVKGLVDEVNEASRQQAQGIDQVSQAITRMERVTQGAAATAEESAAVSEELNAQAETSLQVVADLATLVGGDTATPAAPVVRAQPRTLVMSPRPSKGTAVRHDEEGPRGTGTFGRF